MGSREALWTPTSPRVPCNSTPGISALRSACSSQEKLNECGGGWVREMALLNPGRPKEVGFQTLDLPLPPPFLPLTVASVGGPELNHRGWRGSEARCNSVQATNLPHGTRIWANSGHSQKEGA